MLEQLLDRLALNGDGDPDRRSIVDAAGEAICGSNLRNFRALMNHQSTAKAMQTFEMLETFILLWHWLFLDSDNLKEWTKLLTGLFDTLASAGITSPSYLLTKACASRCMPIIEKLFERAKADTAFQEQLLQPTDRRNPLSAAVSWGGNVEILRYLCQQHGIEAHASNRDEDGLNILAQCGFNSKVEIIELLLDNFPWLASERGGGDVALFKIIKGAGPEQPGHLGGMSNSEAVKSAKLLLHHTQATPGLVDVDELLAEAVRVSWPDMCRMLLVDGHANAQTVVKRSSSGRLELKEHCLEDRPCWLDEKCDDEVLEVIAGYLSEEVLEGITGVQESARRRVKRS